MLRKTNRIQNKRDFSKVFKSSKPIRSGKLVLRYSGGADPSKSRFGFVISNKIDKRSARRNSLKRRLRAIAREFLPSAPSGKDIIIIVTENYNFPYDYALIREDFISAMQKAGFIK